MRRNFGRRARSKTGEGRRANLVSAPLSVMLATLLFFADLRCQNRPEPAAAAPATRELSLEERADLYMARKSYADATDYYRRALKQSGYSNALLWNKLGVAFQQQSNHRAARKAYIQATRIKKDYAEPWNNIGTTYYVENHFRKSVRYYLKAIKLDSSSASFHLNLGGAYFHLKRFKEAVDEYRTAVSLDPNIMSQRSSVGTVLQTRGSEADYYFYMAKVFASLNQPEEAVRYLRRAFEDGFKSKGRLELDPDFQKIKQHPGYIQLLKNPPPAIRD